MKIEKGIPLPPRKGRGLSEAALLMQSMKKGDSLFLKSRTSVPQMAIKYIGKGKYAMRSEGSGVRVWKVK